MQALALAEYGIAQKIITAVTEISKSSIYRLKQQARDRGYNPSQFKKLLNSYVSDAPRFGRPTVISREIEDAILPAIRRDRYGREKTSYMLAAEQGLSLSIVLRFLNRHEFRAYKIIKKSSLTEAMKETRYQFALRY